MIALTLAPGTRIAERYRITGLIAQGGMGAVHDAVDERLSRDVALKTLRTELATDDTEVTRFEREVQMSARLSHPGIAQVLDFGRTRDGLLYLVMERIRGETLAAVLTREKRVSPLRAADIVAQALSALASAHAEGILHRDLKPGNVMVVPNGASELVKVLDFGIAHRMDDAAITRLTQTGVILGTPAFMAPEQARGEALDARVDVYAMGVLLWCLLTGQKPFLGESMAETIDAVLHVIPQRADMVVPGIPHALASVADVAMQKDPSQRYVDANAMAHALALARARSSFPPRTEAQAPSIFALSPPSQRISMPAIHVASSPPPEGVSQAPQGLASLVTRVTQDSFQRGKPANKFLAAGFLAFGSMTAAALFVGYVAFDVWTSRARAARLASISEPTNTPVAQAAPPPLPPPLPQFATTISPEGNQTAPLNGSARGVGVEVTPECAQAFHCCRVWFGARPGGETVCAQLIDGQGEIAPTCAAQTQYYADMIRAVRRSDIDCTAAPGLGALPSSN